MKDYAKVLKLLSKNDLKQDLLIRLMKGFISGYEEVENDSFFEILKLFNPPFKKIAVYKDGGISYNIGLNTKDILLKNAKFCFVDIETTGGVDSGNIIDLGAAILQNNENKGEFTRLVHSSSVPEIIENLTGITASMLENAPTIDVVLNEFREFLGDCIFVAHNVSFDYNYLYHAFISKKIYMLNPYLCTVKLARRCISSQKYSLSYLNDFLEIHTQNVHRALPDAITSREIFKICLQNLPENILSVHDLITFSESSVKKS